MRRMLTLFICCLCLSSCVSDGKSVEIDITKAALKGKWEQTISLKDNRYFMEFTDNTMRLFKYDTDNHIIYLINGAYLIDGDSIQAKDLTTGSYKKYRYEMPYCTLMFFGDFSTGFTKNDGK